MISTGRSNYPEILKKMWLPILELLHFFHQIFKIFSIWPSSFRGEDFFNISQSETRIALGGHICWRNGTKWRNVIEDLI
jgi:putative heme iron utilization protein